MSRRGESSNCEKWDNGKYSFESISEQFYQSNNTLEFLTPVFDFMRILQDFHTSCCNNCDHYKEDIEQLLSDNTTTCPSDLAQRVFPEKCNLSKSGKELLANLDVLFSFNVYFMVNNGVDIMPKAKGALEKITANSGNIIDSLSLPPNISSNTTTDMPIDLIEYIKRTYPGLTKIVSGGLTEWTEILKEMYFYFKTSGVIREDYYNYSELNDMEFLRCYSLPFDFKSDIHAPGLTRMHQIAVRAVRQSERWMIELFRYYMFKEDEKITADYYSVDQIRETSKFVNTIAQNFDRDNYKELICCLNEAIPGSEDRQKRIVDIFRKFLLRFVEQKNIPLPYVYDTNTMDVEFECFQKSLILCRGYLLTSLRERYNDLLLGKLHKKSDKK